MTKVLKDSPEKIDGSEGYTIVVEIGRWKPRRMPSLGLTEL